MRYLLAVIVAAALIIAQACDGAAKDPPLDADDLTFEELYALVGEAISRPGFVYHAVSETEADAGPLSYEANSESWVDTGRDVVRQEAEITYSEGISFKSLQITASGALYRAPSEGQPSSKVEARECHDASASISTVIGCPGPLEESTKTLENGDYDGQDAIVVVTTGTSHGEDENRLYLHSTTLLPIAVESQGTADYGEVEPTSSLTLFETGFVLEESLPGDFFDPASIGYVESEHDPEERLENVDPGFPMYWLGRDFEAGDGLPPLTLSIAYYNEARGTPDPRLTLDYRPADDEFAPPYVELLLWDSAAWESFLAQSRGGDGSDLSCRESKKIEWDSGHATIFHGSGDQTPGCPHGLVAYVYLEGTVVHVSAPSGCDGDVCDANPYATPAGLEAVARGLTPRP